VGVDVRALGQRLEERAVRRDGVGVPPVVPAGVGPGHSTAAAGHNRLQVGDLVRFLQPVRRSLPHVAPGAVMVDHDRDRLTPPKRLGRPEIAPLAPRLEEDPLLTISEWRYNSQNAFTFVAVADFP
ncbi:MAG: hypothetical protein DRP11_03760, partial [Candidatus Aenigmatarchaeota archaeon]